jgi:hypothetical protein
LPIFAAMAVGLRKQCLTRAIPNKHEGDVRVDCGHVSLFRGCVSGAKAKSMRHLGKSIAALLVGLAVAGFAPPPADDIGPTRIAAIVKCTKVAQTRYPDDDEAQQRGRYLAYKQCMTDAGEAP